MSRAIAQINLVVRDMAASLAFYRRLGLDVNAVARPEWAPHHASVELANGARLELDRSPSPRCGTRAIATGAAAA